VIAAAQILSLSGFCVIGALPLLYFRRGEFNIRWWATAVPFFVTPLAVLAVGCGWLAPAVDSTTVRTLLSAASLLPGFLGIALIERTVKAHRTRPALWHQEDDEPPAIVRWGPYRRIRHPFYAAFLLIFVSAALAAPHWLVWSGLGYTLAMLNLTAAREERRLLAGGHGPDYRSYMAVAGRFLPRFSGVSG
jgi:protein-S-isoprenylcysteine O-methyltransferase Ste14